VLLDDARDECQPVSASLIVSRLPGLEDLIVTVRRQPCTVVGDVEPAGRATSTDVYVRSTVFDCVPEEVLEQCLQLCVVGLHHRQIVVDREGCCLCIDRVPGPPGGLFECHRLVCVCGTVRDRQWQHLGGQLFDPRESPGHPLEVDFLAGLACGL